MLCVLAEIVLSLGVKRTKAIIKTIILITEVSILSTSEPVTGILIAMIFLGERMVALQALGALGVLAALVFIALPARRQETHPGMGRYP